MAITTENKILGHILFTRVSVYHYPDKDFLGLAPMADLPKLQNKGIGSSLKTKNLVEPIKQASALESTPLGFIWNLSDDCLYFVSPANIKD